MNDLNGNQSFGADFKLLTPGTRVFVSCKFKDVKFTKEIEGCTFKDCGFENCSFHNLRSRNVFFFNCLFNSCTLENAKLHSSGLYSCELVKCDISWLKITSTNCKLRDCTYNNVGGVDRFPVNIDGMCYQITLVKDYLEIGCQMHHIDSWAKFSEQEIGGMEGVDNASKAIKFWDSYGLPLLMMAKQHFEGK